MSLITEKAVKSFDLTQIKRGYLLWGKHYTWKDGKAGFVTSATEKELIIQFHPGIGNVTNHFVIPVSEAAAGQWEIRWSSDMTKVYEYGTDEQGTEGDNSVDET